MVGWVIKFNMLDRLYRTDTTKINITLMNITRCLLGLCTFHDVSDEGLLIISMI